MRSSVSTLCLMAAVCLAASMAPPRPAIAADPDRDARRPANPQGELGSSLPVSGRVPGFPVGSVRSAVVNFADLARREAQVPASQRPAVRPLIRPELDEDMAEPTTPGAPVSPSLELPQQPLVASPSPSTSFMGLDDIPMVDSSYIIIPPDVAGGVGPTRVMSSFNNNYRVQDKATGAIISTVGTATFWNSVITDKRLLIDLTDPRTTYDPINNRWIVAMQTVNTNGLLLLGVSQTSDPAGSWFLYAFGGLNGGGGNYLIDFPILGFNKNWIVLTINLFSSPAGAFQHGITLAANYPQARAGTLTGANTFLFQQSANSHFCSAPAATISATEDTLFVVTHLSSGSATYTVDAITGTSTPSYFAVGSASTRPGGGWTQPNGQILPQSAPVSGSSACGATPCPIETQDSQVRSAPVYRVDTASGRGYLYYTQTIGLPSGGLTHTAVQWTKLTASTTPAFADGGRLDDPTATNSNGGKWYAYPHIAVNAAGDFIVGYSQFSSAQHPSAGYSYHLHTDAAGTLRDPFIYKAGDDYYHKTFSTTLGRDRWGDFSTAQVDPSDDMTLWVLQEYAKPRASTNDDSTGHNGSRWSSWWAGVSPTGGPVTFTINASAGANGSISPNGAVVVNQGASQSFTITPNSCYHVADVLVDGSSAGAVTNYTFNNVQANHTIAASFAIDSLTITASAGAGGTITPSGAVKVACGSSKSFTIAAGTGHHVSDVLVDGGSVGAVTTYNFTNVIANHTIAASFAIDSFTVSVAITGQGSVAKSPNQLHYAYGQNLTLTANPSAGWAFSAWSGDISSSTNPLGFTVLANTSLTATFVDATAPSVQVTGPAGGASFPIGSIATLAWNASDNVGVTSVDLRLSRSGAGGPFDSIAAGIANTGSYDWTVTGPATTDAFLQVTAHDAAGLSASDVSDSAFIITGGAAVGDPTGVADFALPRVWPHPIQGSAHIRYALPRSVPVRLAVYDALGRQVEVLDEGERGAGMHEVVWTGSHAGPGLYFLRLAVPGRMLVRRVVRVE